MYGSCQTLTTSTLHEPTTRHLAKNIGVPRSECNILYSFLLCSLHDLSEHFIIATYLFICKNELLWVSVCPSRENTPLRLLMQIT